MLSLATLNGKGLAPAVVRPPGKETPLEKVVVDLEIVTAERFGPTRKIKNKEVEEVFRSITGHKLGMFKRGGGGENSVIQECGMSINTFKQTARVLCGAFLSLNWML